MGDTGGIVHGARELPSVVVESYNLELRSGEAGAFLGDRASKKAFSRILNDWRERMRAADADTLGEEREAPGKKKLDAALVEGSVEEAGLVFSAIDEFAGELATVIRRFLKQKSWDGAQRIAIGGGLRESRTGELAIGRAAVLLKTDGINVDLVPIKHNPDEAGLIGAAHLTPAWMLKGHDSLLAIDIGGTNIRVGIVRHRMADDATLARADVWKSKLWRHADDKPSRTGAVERMAEMAIQLRDKALQDKLALAPFIGVACPGLIEADGSIKRGGQNLPGGNWESERFNLPRALADAIPEIAGEKTFVLMHNDAVVQGLSQIPFMQDVERWGILTIGTGLGNARFTNR